MLDDEDQIRSIAFDESETEDMVSAASLPGFHDQEACRVVVYKTDSQ